MTKNARLILHEEIKRDARTQLEAFARRQDRTAGDREFGKVIGPQVSWIVEAMINGLLHHYTIRLRTRRSG